MTLHMFKEKKKISLLHKIPTQFEFEGCELKEESTFAESLFGEVPQIQKDYGYSVLLLLLSDDSPLQEYLTELRLII